MMPKPRIPDDIRKQAVDAYCFGTETTVAIARRLGISQGVLARLVRECDAANGQTNLLDQIAGTIENETEGDAQ